jgi:hypothetical protein
MPGIGDEPGCGIAGRGAVGIVVGVGAACGVGEVEKGERAMVLISCGNAVIGGAGRAGGTPGLASAGLGMAAPWKGFGAVGTAAGLGTAGRSGDATAVGWGAGAGASSGLRRLNTAHPPVKNSSLRRRIGRRQASQSGRLTRARPGEQPAALSFRNFPAR